MKKFVALISIVLVFSLLQFPVFGQGNGQRNCQGYENSKGKHGNREKARAQMNKDIDRLELSDEQAASYCELNQKYGKMLRALRDEDLVRDEKQKKAEEIKTERDKEMKALLSEEQFIVFQEISAERQQARKQNRNQNRGKNKS